MCLIPEASETEGRTLCTSGVLGRSTGIVSPNPSQARGPPSVCRPLCASRAATARLVSPGDTPRQKNLLFPGRLRRAPRSRLTPVILACPIDPGQSGARPGGGRDHEQHRAGEQARSVPPAGRPRLLRVSASVRLAHPPMHVSSLLSSRNEPPF